MGDDGKADIAEPNHYQMNWLIFHNAILVASAIGVRVSARKQRVLRQLVERDDDSGISHGGLAKN